MIMGHFLPLHVRAFLLLLLHHGNGPVMHNTFSTKLLLSQWHVTTTDNCSSKMSTKDQWSSLHSFTLYAGELALGKRKNEADLRAFHRLPCGSLDRRGAHLWLWWMWDHTSDLLFANDGMLGWPCSTQSPSGLYNVEFPESKGQGNRVRVEMLFNIEGT